VSRIKRSQTRRPTPGGENFLYGFKGGSLRSRHGRPAVPGVRSVPAGPGAPGRPLKRRASATDPRAGLLHRLLAA
jgi:hypothetical protein